MADSARSDRGYGNLLVFRQTKDCWEALGEFVSTFSSVEVNMQLAFPNLNLAVSYCVNRSPYYGVKRSSPG